MRRDQELLNGYPTAWTVTLWLPAPTPHSVTYPFCDCAMLPAPST
ncbi:MAG TPA: hypothetical protein VEL02_04250 [Jatrophihabitantaceae bacterium]|nr:hypothetical protein [Jatrophihabitantaceae bacterium]